MLNKIHILLVTVLLTCSKTPGQNIRSTTNDNLLGTWSQVTLDKDGVVVPRQWFCGNETIWTMTFSKDHQLKYESVSYYKGPTRDMLWEYDPETNILNISSSERRSSDGSPYGGSIDYFIKKLDSETLILQMINLPDGSADHSGTAYKKLPKKD
ncbi:MAG TPA: hypothetical protein PL029_04490 [Bacteroidia bacterium]|nr:hypothetical protein [Bacteroidia bacterium]